MKPQFAPASLDAAMQHHRAGRLQQAEELYKKFPQHPDALHLRGMIALQSGRHMEAVELVGKAILAKPSQASYYPTFEQAARAAGQLIEAYRRLLEQAPDNARAHAELGTHYLNQGRLDEARTAYEAALALQQFPETWNNLGLVSHRQGRLDEAVSHYLKALEISPEFAEAYNNLGNTLRVQEKFDDAILCYRQVVALQPDRLDTHNMLGSLLRRQGRYDEALHSYLSALMLKPDNPLIHNNLGLLFADQKNEPEALKSYQTALALKPDMEEALNNLGSLHYAAGRIEEAIASFDKVVTLYPGSVDVWTNLGHAYHKHGQPDSAIACYRKAIALNPAFLNAHQGMLMAMQYSSQVTPEEMTSAHVAFGRQFETPLRALWQPHANERDPGKRLRIGYLSADFRKHSVAYFIEPLLALHDRSQFEVVCYYNHTQVDTTTERLQQLADHWVNCRFLNDDQLAAQIRADGIDILIDLAGHTGGNRLLTFARKPAPVQVTYLGYPCTTGLTAMDYRLTDVHAEPVGMSEAFSIETLWRLPEIFCCYRAHDNSPDVIDHPPALDNGFVTFGCFNNFSKVTDEVLTLWGQILQRVPNSQLMLEIAGLDNGTLRANIETRLARLGLPVERLQLVARRPENQYVLYNRIDIALDPFPANGGTTSLDTLWMGVPFVTLVGRHFTSRMGVTILHNAGLPELIADSEDDYVGIAVRLATDLTCLAALRDGLRQRVQASPLMDAPRFTQQLEQAYRGMWQAWCAKEQAA